MGDPNLVTTCNFHGEEFLFKMNVICNNLEILITDKSSGEEWQCSYDASYIENLTRKTGNFKQFDIFVAMIKSGLLRTSESVTLDLLTFEDLELLRSRKIIRNVGYTNNNRRYLIVTYIVEFDKIRYPLPLEYCGPPDPLVLQSTIRRLEVELAKSNEKLALKSNGNDSKKIYFLQRRIDELTEENLELTQEIRRLTAQIGKKPKVLSLQKAVSTLEKCVVSERNSHHELVEKLKNDKVQLELELVKIKQSEKDLKAKLHKSNQTSKLCIRDQLKLASTNKSSHSSMQTVYKRNKSPFNRFEFQRGRARKSENFIKPTNSWDQSRKMRSIATCIRSRDSSTSSTKYGDAEYLNLCDTSIPFKRHSPSPQRNQLHCQSRSSSHESRASSKGSLRNSAKSQNKNLDYKKLEEKIANLQRLLKNSGICDKES
ncbi:centrosomal protein CCDC61-like isoform X1 [Diabrotica undecimpunctata]|uniref:centrosomal protein CCDC61-like isoform X1 n=1 Tax=Diabrotica undecimpunctata TaxID=50387 RepID=UPI003B63D080